MATISLPQKNPVINSVSATKKDVHYPEALGPTQGGAIQPPKIFEKLPGWKATTGAKTHSFNLEHPTHGMITLRGNDNGSYSVHHNGKVLGVHTEARHALSHVKDVVNGLSQSASGLTANGSHDPHGKGSVIKSELKKTMPPKVAYRFRAWMRKLISRPKLDPTPIQKSEIGVTLYKSEVVKMDFGSNVSDKAKRMALDWAKKKGLVPVESSLAKSANAGQCYYFAPSTGHSLANLEPVTFLKI